MRRWRRPYEATGDMTLGVVMICTSAVVGAVFTFVLVGNFLLNWGIKLTDFAPPLVAVPVVAVVGASKYRVGLYHNDHGVRIQYLIRFRIVPGSSIAAIESRSIPLSSRREVRVIVLVTVRGAEIVTPVGVATDSARPRGKKSRPGTMRACSASSSGVLSQRAGGPTRRSTRP